VKFRDWMSRARAMSTVAVLFGTTMGASASAEAVKLKFAIFVPDTEQTYLTVFKPFAEAVNKEGAGIVEIDLFPNGALGRSPVQQAQMVLDGLADIAWIVPCVYRKFGSGWMQKADGLNLWPAECGSRWDHEPFANR